MEYKVTVLILHYSMIHERNTCPLSFQPVTLPLFPLAMPRFSSRATLSSFVCLLLASPCCLKPVLRHKVSRFSLFRRQLTANYRLHFHSPELTHAKRLPLLTVPLRSTWQLMHSCLYTIYNLRSLLTC